MTLCRNRREGAGDHRQGRPRIAGHHPGSAPVGQVLQQALHERARLGQRVHACRFLQSVEGKRYSGTIGARTSRTTSPMPRWSCSSAAATATASVLVGAEPGRSGRGRNAVVIGRSAPQQHRHLCHRLGAYQAGNRYGVPAWQWRTCSSTRDLYDHEFVEQNTVGFRSSLLK